MTYFAVPFHLDVRLPAFPLPISARPIAPELPDGTVWERLAALYDRVADEVRADDAPVVLSGDCLTSLGVLAGLRRRGVEPAIVWFDAHGDLNTPETSPSGYLGGMPLALALGHGSDIVPASLGLPTALAEQVLLVDARDLGPGERELIAAAPLRHVPVGGVSSWLVPDGPVYLHVDLDILDPDEVPGMMYPVSGGPSLPTLLTAIRAVVSTGRVVSAGIAVTCQPGAVGESAVQDSVKDILAALEW